MSAYACNCTVARGALHQFEDGRLYIASAQWSCGLSDRHSSGVVPAEQTRRAVGQIDSVIRVVGLHRVKIKAVLPGEGPAASAIIAPLPGFMKSPNLLDN